MSTQSIVATTGIRRANVLPTPPTAVLPRRVAWRVLAKIVMRIWMICLAIICLAVTYGQFQAAFETAARLGFASCGDVPCFRDMLPGRTRWADVRATFTERPVIKLAPLKGDIVLSPTSDGLWLGSIVANIASQHIPLGEIVALYGVPSYIAMRQHADRLTMHYPLLYVVVQVTGDRLMPDAPVNNIILRSTSDERVLYQCRTNAFFDATAGWIQVDECPWQGFVALQQYRTEP